MNLFYIITCEFVWCLNDGEISAWLVHYNSTLTIHDFLILQRTKMADFEEVIRNINGLGAQFHRSGEDIANILSYDQTGDLVKRRLLSVDNYQLRAIARRDQRETGRGLHSKG